MDVLALSRLQFALTIMFHYLFPPLTIGLSLVIVYLLALRLATGQAIYESAAKFWTKIFGLNFAVGVASGIVMEFQFGTNWAFFSRYVGDVFGSALAAEGVFAFFLESGFLAILLFGWERVSKGFHFFAALMVCLGSIFSSIWITVANSWQQTPAGSTIRQHGFGEQAFIRAEITDFWALLFNPSSVDRLLHVWFGAFVLGAFFVMSISAWYLLHGRHGEFARRSFTGALILGTLFSIAQVVSGHHQARGVAENQPAKLAAFEAHWTTRSHAPLYLFGWPDTETRRVRWGVGIPGLLSWLIHEDTAAVVPGLDELEPRWGKPPVWLSFQSYHVMVGIGFLFLAATLLASFLRWRGRLFETRWLMWFFVFAIGLAFAANELGWAAAEVGRQPWTVYPTVVDGQLTGGLRTADALSEVVSAEQVLASIAMFVVLYSLLFALWVMVLDRKIRQGPEPVATADEVKQPTGVLATAARWLGHEGSLTGSRRPDPRTSAPPPGD